MTISIPSWLLWALGFVGGIIAFFMIVVVLMYAYIGHKTVKEFNTNFRIVP